MIENKLADELLRAQRALANVSGPMPARAEAAYGELHPAVSNIPLERAAFQQILLGRVPIVDLHPDDEAGFLKRHGFSVKTAIKLAERRVIVPNVYVTNPSRWKDAARSVVDLANHPKSIVSEKRAEVLLGASFDAAKVELEASYRSATHGFGDRDWLMLSTRVLRRPEANADDIVKALATRAARVKVAVAERVWSEAVGYPPHRGSKADRLRLTVAQGRRVRSANHVHAGFVSASAGRPYLPGEVELEMAHDAGFIFLSEPVPSREVRWSEGATFVALELNLPVPAGASSECCRA